MQSEATKSVHEGRNVKRIREILGIKQEALASELGLSQQAVSSLEQREALDKEMLEKVAAALKIAPEAIKNFNEDGLVTNISCSFNDHSANVNYNFNPLDKLMEALEENKKLYEALLKSEREKNALLERMISK